MSSKVKKDKSKIPYMGFIVMRMSRLSLLWDQCKECSINVPTE